MPRRRRQSHRLERVLGTPALFATAYGNVGSSIYYALGVTAAIALGLTPLVFVVSGLIFACTAATYAEGTVLYPEAGGSSSFARHAFNELVSFGAAWAQMLNYIITVAISAFFVPHYLSIFWEPLKTNPWDTIGGAAVILILVAINIVGVKEAAGLNVFLAVVDFATQLLLVILGFALIFSGGNLRLIPGKWHHLRPLAYAGTTLTAFGLLFSAWGRYHLGQYWSGIISLKEGHRLVRTGPYKLVRHPLYTGFLSAVLATAIAAATYDALLGALLILTAYALKIRREEKVLLNAFGDEYVQFKRETPALIPVPWRRRTLTPKPAETAA